MAKLTNAEDLYDAIKRALNAFGLSWNDKDKLEIEVKGNQIRFHYGYYMYRVIVEEKKDEGH